MSLFVLRLAAPGDEPFLRQMLYLSIFVPPGSPSPPQAIVETPSVARYVNSWGRHGDRGVIVLTGTGEPIGAAWYRLFTQDDPGYGFVDTETPELAMAVLPAFRDQGVGTSMLEWLIDHAAVEYRGLSLSCDPANPAIRLYRRLGFKESGDGRTLRLALRG